MGSSNSSDSSNPVIQHKVIRERDSNNLFGKKKGPAPPPPGESKTKSLENGSTPSAGLAGFQSGPSRPSSRLSDKTKSASASSSRLVISGSAPTSPLLSKKSMTQEAPNEWVFEDG